MSTSSQATSALPLRPSSRAASSLTTANEVVPLFQSRLREILADGRILRDCTARLLKKRLSSRRVVAYKLALADLKTGKRSSVELIGKRYSEQADAKAAREFEAMLILWKAGFGQDARFKIPKPVHHFRDHKLILEERVRGLKLCNFLGRNTQVSLAHARGAGLWLAKLHGLKPTRAVVCSYEEELSSLKVFVNELAAAQPSLAPKVQVIESAIQQKLASFRDVPATMVHGDYHPENILVEGDNITVIDFDRFGVADPARDLGSFIAHMRTMACFSGKSLEGANHEIAEFLDGYFSATPLAKGAWTARRIVPFVAHSCLEALYYVACVMRVSDPNLIAIYSKCAEDSGILKVENSGIGERPGPELARCAGAR